jgi:protein tyrosine/serine phosphatase
VSATERTLAWDGCVNVRDLGGHETGTGPTAYGAVVRADSIRKLSDDGWCAVVDYGIARIVDLRLHEELEADPPADLPVEVVHVSLLGDGRPEDWEEIDRIAAAAPDAASATTAVYLEFLERWRGQFGTAVRAVADAPPGGVLVHCQGGKDRTGLVAALLLRLAGVSIAEIAFDYAVSEENLRGTAAAWIAEAEDEGERERRTRISATPAAAMVRVLEELERRYDSVAGYLRAGGAADETIERAAARLRP